MIYGTIINGIINTANPNTIFYMNSYYDPSYHNGISLGTLKNTFIGILNMICIRLGT